MYKLKERNGRVHALLKSDNDFVKTIVITEIAREIMEGGEVEESERADYPIKVGNWYFEGELTKGEKNGKKVLQ